MTSLDRSLDVEALIAHTRSLWREASGRVSKGRVEVYAKASLRRRAARSRQDKRPTIDGVLETGLAVRTLGDGGDRAGFAASSGLSIDSVRWAVDTAAGSSACASPAAPDHTQPIENERRDLDPDTRLPSAEELNAEVGSRSHVEWVEAGITVEILVGGSGWVAARRRNRVWALAGGATPELSAQRGIRGWKDVLKPHGPHPNSTDSSELTLLPGAAAVLVSALTEHFHGSEPAEWVGAGAGWEVEDQPSHPSGLVGGTFDDVGFATGSRQLAKGGIWVGALRGAGTFRRSSFREPPTEMASNLVVPSAPEGPAAGRIVRHCNLLRLSARVWVVELDFPNGEKTWARTTPQDLLDGCQGRMGVSELAAVGPIVPAIRLSVSGSG